ncbi:helix-turn-helix transcriptional regulator [Taibaiella koreensis]|uniref:helix-turn-helix transcriptional regulator n=1 Tax=Taibaiella koreensis TaxID=1268548 RepID=UPI000E59B3CF|nr:LuxR C-terminal-related transcriptional regulator [Taibaiella koreensis]
MPQQQGYIKWKGRWGRGYRWAGCFIGMFLFCNVIAAQSFIVDSLRALLAQPGLKPETRSLLLAQKGRSLFETDMPAALRDVREAIRLGSTFRDGQYQAFGLANMAYLDVQQDSLLLARRHIDSALALIQQSGNKVIMGYVWLRKGWLEYIVESADQATGSLLKALARLEGRGAYEYESLCYHYLASIYADLKDGQKMEKYTRLSLEAAEKAQNPDVLCVAYLARGSYFMQQFRLHPPQRQLLSEALGCNRRILALARVRPDRILNHSTVAAAALNIANSYWEFFPGAGKDSAVHYINQALEIARPIRHEEVIANCYGILSEYEIADGHYAAAERLFLQGLADVQQSASSSSQVKAKMLRGLATVAEKSGNKDKALRYYKEYLRFAQEAYDAGKLAIVQKLEVQYESERKDRELEVLQERAAFNRRLNYIYIGLAAASLLALVFLFRSYHFRLRASIQQQQLRAEEAARLKAEQELLQERQERLQKELLAGSLQVEEKKDLLHALRDKLGEQTEDLPLKGQVERMIRETQRMDEDFELTKARLVDIHPEFFTRLQQQAAHSLTRLDLKYCSYILMGLSNKEVALRLGIDPKSIRMARYRIKQKLQLDKEDNLDEVIRKMA